MTKADNLKTLFPGLSSLFNIAYLNGILHIDQNGTIKEAEFHHENHPEADYRRIIGKTISDYFFLEDAEAIRHFATPLASDSIPKDWRTIFYGRAFSSRNTFERFDTINDFYTVYPFSRIAFISVKNLGFFGLVRFARHLAWRSPNLRLSPMFFLNSEGRVTGLNSRFGSLFGKEGEKAKDLLNKPILSLCNNNPIQNLSATWEESNEALRAEWQPLLSLEGFQPENVLPSSLAGPCSLEAGRLVWRPHSRNDGGLLAIGIPVNLQQEDLLIEANLTIDSGEILSSILMGNPDPEAVFPDWNGYLVGPSRQCNTLQIKKQGFFLASKPVPVSPQPNQSYSLAFMKLGNQIGMCYNGSPIIFFKDPAMPKGENACQYLYCRNPATIRFQSLRLSTLPAAPKKKECFHLTLKGRPETPIPFRQYLDLYTPPDNQTLYCFTLSEEAESETMRLPESPIVSSSPVSPPFPENEKFIGSTPAIQRLREQALAVAASRLTVLIEGETGTGKEVLANFIHEHSPYRNGPFIKVDCSLLPQSLIESELFGHEKGAFTGAFTSRTGKFESAQGGTLFLDEISNLDLSVQAKLLHFLQDLTLERVGSNRKIQINTRIITATNRPLHAMLQTGTFRADLYYRLNALRLPLPPLRERLSDVPLLVRSFLNEFSLEHGRAYEDLTAEAYQKLMMHKWPGNIRELQSIIRKAALFSKNETIGPESLDLPHAKTFFLERAPLPGEDKTDSRLLTRENVAELLRAHNWVVKRAADSTGISLSTLFRKIKKFGLTRN